jgi:hypothetical protein
VRTTAKGWWVQVAQRGYPKEMQQKAATLRLDGVGRAAIAEQLGVGFSTVCRWFREDGVRAPVSYSGATRAHQEAVAERWTRQQREQDAHRDTVGPLTDRELFLVGVALYWAEGAKSKPWRREHLLKFVNSDESMVRVYLAWLELLAVPRDRLRCRVLIHESADVEAAEAFWRALVGPAAVFHKTTLKRHVPTTVRYNTGESYRGCISITVSGGANLYRRLAGTWEGVAMAASKVSSLSVLQSPVV